MPWSESGLARLWLVSGWHFSAHAHLQHRQLDTETRLIALPESMKWPIKRVAGYNVHTQSTANTPVYLPRVRNRIHWIPRAKDRCCSGTLLKIHTKRCTATLYRDYCYSVNSRQILISIANDILRSKMLLISTFYCMQQHYHKFHTCHYFTRGSGGEVLCSLFSKSVCVSVCLYVCLSASISPEPHARSLPIFCACRLWLWLRSPAAGWWHPKGNGQFCGLSGPFKSTGNLCCSHRCHIRCKRDHSVCQTSANRNPGISEHRQCSLSAGWVKERKGKGKEQYLYSAFLHQGTHKAPRHGSHSFTCKQHHACLSFVAFTRCHHHSNWGRRHPIVAHYSFIDPKRMKGWVGLVGSAIADGLPT